MAGPLGPQTDDERLCFQRGMEQWRASLKRPDLSEEDRVRGALDAYCRQAFALALSPAEGESQWRDLALQFDGHRIEALSLLRYVSESQNCAEATSRAHEVKAFLSKPPLSGEAVLAERIKSMTAVFAAPLGLSPLPWKYVNSRGNPARGMADWIEDAHGNIVLENVGHIDGPFIVAHANAAAPEVETALRYAYAAIHSMLDQIGQMRGMFADEDGTIQRAVDDGDAAIEDIAKALAKIA